MAFIYGLVRAISAIMLKMANWRKQRAMKALDVKDATYRKLETSVKSDEVASGNAASMQSQLRLLRLLEQREAAHDRFVATSTSWKKRKRFHDRVKAFEGKKLPYTFGLIDMALVMKVCELAYEDRLRLDMFSQLWSWIS